MPVDAIRVDAHQHFWRYETAAYPWIDASMSTLRRDRLPADVAPAMQAEGIACAIAVQARADEAENAFLLALADATAQIAAVVGWIDLFAGNAAERVAAWAAHARFRGVRHLLQDDANVASTLADTRFNAGVRAVQQHALVYEVLVRGPDQLAHVPAFCARHDAHALVLDHLGKPAIGGDSEAAWTHHLRALAALSHVHCKVSGLITEVATARIERDAIFRHLDTALDAFGARRLIFGSDWPVCLLRADYAHVVALLRDWADSRLDAPQRAALWGGNAIRCYGLDVADGGRDGP